ncbi:MAG: hypothetical protein H0U74_07910 [Bradymonadaceae bacterium]|nr:hypothetical protein [Lujinxingiaceae bacterium]
MTTTPPASTSIPGPGRCTLVPLAAQANTTVADNKIWPAVAAFLNKVLLVVLSFLFICSVIFFLGNLLWGEEIAQKFAPAPVDDGKLRGCDLQF